MRAVVYDLPKHWLAEWLNSGSSRWGEIWEGVLHMPPPHTAAHSKLSLDLCTYLYQCWAKPHDGDVIRDCYVTTPAGAALMRAEFTTWSEWAENREHDYRVADVALLGRDNLHLGHGEFVAGPPLVVVMVRAPFDETYDKFPFYAALGVPEVWVFDRDTRAPELYALASGPAYQPVAAVADGWLVSPAAGVAFRHAGGAKVAVRVGDGPTVELPGV